MYRVFDKSFFIIVQLKERYGDKPWHTRDEQYSTSALGSGRIAGIGIGNGIQGQVLISIKRRLSQTASSSPLGWFVSVATLPAAAACSASSSAM